MSSSKKPFRVLSLDGGGMRGLYTASVLSTLAQRFSPKNPLDIGKGFDLIVGTSTGGILACALASGVSIDRVIDLYRNEGPKIFGDPVPKNVAAKLLWAIRNLLSPANPNDQLRSSLKAIFGNETLGILYARRKIGLCITSLDLATHKSKVFKTAHDPKRSADDARTLEDVCIATSAAPIILPVGSIANPHIQGQVSHFVDGGLWANNPVLIALVEALHVSETDQPIEIISIGTCPPPSGGVLLPSEAKRGLLGWNFGIRALELSMDGQASGHQFMAEFLIQHLVGCGRHVNLLRLDQSAPSAEQANHLGLDCASERARSTLIELGNSDALMIYGRSLKAADDYQRLHQIFSQIPIFTA